MHVYFLATLLLVAGLNPICAVFMSPFQRRRIFLHWHKQRDLRKSWQNTKSSWFTNMVFSVYPLLNAYVMRWKGSPFGHSSKWQANCSSSMEACCMCMGENMTQLCLKSSSNGCSLQEGWSGHPAPPTSSTSPCFVQALAKLACRLQTRQAVASISFSQVVK